MPEPIKTIAILASTEPQLTEWGTWLATDGFDIYPALHENLHDIPEDVALILLCQYRLEDDPTLILQLRALFPLAPVLGATNSDSARDMLVAGVDDIVTDPIIAPVLQNRVHQMLPRTATFAETIQQTAAVLVGPFSQTELLELVLHQIKEVMPSCDAANIVLLGSDLDEMLIAHHAAYFDPNDDSERTILRKFEHRLSELPNFQRMVATQQPLLIPDRFVEPMWKPMKDTHWVRCYLGAPVVVQDEVIGFINVDSATPSAFNLRQARQLQSFAYHVGVAIYNTRLIEQLTAATELLEETVDSRTYELERERARLQIILDSIGEGVVYYNEDGLPVYANRAVEDMFGYTLDEWPIGGLLDTVRKRTREEVIQYGERIQKTLDRKGIWQTTGPARRKDSTTLDVQVTVRPQTDGYGNVIVYRDISQEKALMERQARFVAYASHELRTPITNIQTQLYLVRRRPNRATHHLNVIEEVVGRMNTLVENLLTLSRIGNGQLATEKGQTDLREVVLAVHRVQGAEAARANIRLALVVPGDPLILNADYERLVQVITNLTVNALLYTGDGKQITLRLTKTHAPPPNLIHSNPSIYEVGFVDMVPNWAVIRVQDEGKGIPDEHLPHLFQPFYRASDGQPGTGLGLTIAAEIARLHEGSLSVESELGKGSTFSLWLPLVPSEETAKR